MRGAGGRALLGRGILSRLGELREPGRMEAFLLYAGQGPGPVVIHRGRVQDEAGFTSECFTLGVDGELLYRGVGPADPESGVEPVELVVPLRVEGDFEKVGYDSVTGLHEAVMSEGFFDSLAYRLGRGGRVGYGDVYALDVDVELRESRRLRLR